MHTEEVSYISRTLQLTSFVYSEMIHSSPGVSSDFRSTKVYTFPFALSKIMIIDHGSRCVYVTRL
jgi:hypothetical protein